MKINLTLSQRDTVLNPVRYQMQQDGLWTVYEIGDELPVLPEPTIVPEATRLQFKLALSQLGLLAEVEAYIAGQPGNDALRLHWAEAQTFQRNHPLVIAATAALNKTDTEVDMLFALAQTL